MITHTTKKIEKIPRKTERGKISNYHLENTNLGDTNEDIEMSTYQQANSIAQNLLDVTTFISDLTAPQNRPLKHIE